MRNAVLGTAALAGMTPAQRFAYLTEPVALPGLKKRKRADPATRPKSKSALIAVLEAIHAPMCVLSKSDRLVAVCLAWHLHKAGKPGVQLGLEALMKETNVGRSLVMDAITELCGKVEEGPTRWRLFTRKHLGLGRPNLYALNARFDGWRTR